MVRLETTYLNQRIEMLGGVWDEARESQLSAVSRLYNRNVGPVTGVKLVRPELLDLSLYGSSCKHSSLPALLRDLTVKARPHGGLVPGGGKGANPVTALLGALGEMTERLLAILHVTTLFDRIIYGTYNQLAAEGRMALAPKEVPLFASEQYADPRFDYRPFRSDSVVGWVEGSDLMTGEPVWVPAQLVLMHQRRNEQEVSIGYATTSGLACHTSRRQAILHGLYEVIERDALNVCWYSRLVPPRVSVDLESVLADAFQVWPARMSTPYVRDVGIYLLTLDAPLSVLAAVAFDASRTERAFLGGTGAAGRPDRALGQALFELGQCQTGFHFDNPFGRRPIYEDTPLEQVVEFFDAPLYYGYDRNLPRTVWFAQGPNSVQWDHLPSLAFDGEEEEFARLTNWLRSSGIQVIVFDFDDASPAGIHITKVFVPQLTHACPPKNPMLGHPRFAEIPMRLGRADRPLRFTDLNPDPIPFA